MNANNEEVKEIDLYLLLKRGGLFIFRKKWYMVLFLILGLLLGYFQVSKNSDKYTNYYQTEFYIKSSFISQEILYTLVQNLAVVYKDENDSYSEIKTSIKKIVPEKDISLDGLRFNLKVTVDLKSPQKSDEIISFTKKYIESTDYYNFHYKLETNHLKKLNFILDSQLDSLSNYINGSDFQIAFLKDKKNNPNNYLAYVSLVERKQSLKKSLEVLENSFVFLPVEPDNKLVNLGKFKVMTYIGSCLVLIICGIILLVIFDFARKIKTSKITK